MQKRQSPLAIASFNGEEELVKILLETGADTRIVDKDGKLPLHLACMRNDNHKIVKLLIEYNSPLDVMDNKGKSAIEIAFENGDVTILKMSLKAGASIHSDSKANRNGLLLLACEQFKYDMAMLIASHLSIRYELDETNECGETAIHLACKYNRIDLVELLLKQRADMNIIDSNVQTPLTIACNSGNHQIAEKLIAAGADINIINDDKIPLLMLECVKKKYDIAKLIASHPSIKNLDATNENGETALHLACIRNRIDLVELLLKQRATGINIRDKKYLSPLMIACGRGYKKVAEMLIQAGADIHTRNKGAETALHFACRYDRIDLVELLLKSGAIGIDIKDRNGQTPLMIACGRGYQKLAEILFEAGANISAPTKYGGEGSTALHSACYYNRTAMVEWLLKRGGAQTVIDFRNWNGHTPLEIACSRGYKELMEQLIEAGANINIGNKYDKSLIVVACEKKNYEVAMLIANHIAAYNECGETAIHLACKYNRVDLVAFLLKREVDTNIRDKNGKTPLMIACDIANFSFDESEYEKLTEGGAHSNNQNEDCGLPLLVACERKQYGIAMLMLYHPAIKDLDASNKDGQTSLHLACLHNNTDMVTLLLKQGADMNIRDSKGQTPLTIACDKGLMKIVKRLINSGADINMPNEYGRTVLTISYENKDDKLMKLILMAGRNNMILLKDGIAIISKAFECKRYNTIFVMIEACPSLLNVVDSNGQTALHLACNANKTDMVRRLLHQGSYDSINIRDKNGRTAFSIACDQGNTEIMKILVKAGCDLKSLR